ncbi:MAG: NADPH2:quinone reductase [Cellvibrionaceae bacterium]|jgi:NADPH2:quinone reductase
MTDVNSIRFSQVGDSEVLRFETRALPALESGQVLVRHEVIGVNFIDTYQRTGLYPVALPSGLGTEAAGVVEAVGANVTRAKVGDRVVYASASLGAYSEAHVVPEKSLIAIPENIDSKIAAAMTLKGLTAAYLLLKTFPLQPNHSVLIHAAAGGVGSILTQWAKAIGAHVIGTVGRPEKVALAKSQGCDEVILYREEDVPAAVKTLTAGRGVDVVYDSVGKDTFDMSINSLKSRGMLVSFGNASGAVPAFAPLLLAQKGSLFITRPTLIHYVADPDEQQELADALFKRVLNGEIKINVNHEFALNDAKSAHDALESGTTTGSVVLIP